MLYTANFKDINMTPFQVDIYTQKGDGTVELTLTGDPVMITWESNGLFSPIKSQSCTINILTEEAMLDLYTTDPQGIYVEVKKLGNNNNITVFRGYATPCQYGMNWTSKDVLTLECVEMLSSLKNVNYSPINGLYPKYVAIDKLISYIISKSISDRFDQLYYAISWHWPCDNFSGVNGSTFNNTKEMIGYLGVSEANFFDDDEDETPWTCYEVLEEICKFYNVTLVPYNGSYYFVDYLYTATPHNGNSISFWQYSLDLDVSQVSITRDFPITTGMETYGTMELGMDDVFNKISVNANRYDIEELVTDIYDKKKHQSITLTHDFGGSGQTYTETHVNFWGSTVTDAEPTTTFKTYCILKGAKGWKHRWWSPRTLNELFGTEDGWSSGLNGNTGAWLNLPENKYINTIGATMLHYCTIDATNRKPSSLDWKDVIMFNCLTAQVKPTSTNTVGKCTMGDFIPLYPTFEKPVLEYESDYDLNYSPKNGTSWIVINAALWYQQYRKKGASNSNGSLKWNIEVTDPVKHEQIMWPIEDATGQEPYIGFLTYTKNGSTNNIICGHSSASEYGHDLLRISIRIGDPDEDAMWWYCVENNISPRKGRRYKFWNGSQWVQKDTESQRDPSFLLRFTASGIDGKYDHVDFNTSDDAFAYLKWMNIITNTTYQDQVGTSGYAIPITNSDQILGKLKVTLYTPRQIPRNQFSGSSSWFDDEEVDWYERAPIVFMKDFSIDYVYTGTTPWWLDAEHDKKDIKYTQYTQKAYTYEKEITSKINCWQDDNPIAKSFMMAAGFEPDGTIHPQSLIHYVHTVKDNTTPNLIQAQEENVCMRQLRHYSEPRLKVKMNVRTPVAPWAYVTLSQASGLNNKVFVLDKQEFDVRGMNSTISLVEFGDTSIK